MLLPSKHIHLSECILGIGAFVLEALKPPMSLDALKEALDDMAAHEKIPASPSLEHVLLAINFLYAVGVIAMDAEGRLVRCASSR
jgi:hypothetical protein